MQDNEHVIPATDSNGTSHLNLLPDVFQNEFDLTWMAGLPEYKKEYTIIPIEQAEDDGKVIYSYNGQGFRADDFKETHDGMHILFSGCSQTEGVGSPIDTVWTKMLVDKIGKTNKVDGFYSIARAGQGWQKIIANYMVYVKRYGHPDYFFVMLPQIGRFWDWNTLEQRWYYVQRYPTSDAKSFNNWWNSQDEQDKDFFRDVPLTLKEHRKMFIDFTVGWKLFEEFCNSNNTKLLWASCDYLENLNYHRLPFSTSYVNLPFDELVEFIEKNTIDGKTGKYDIYRRDGHMGILHHKYWYEKFLLEINKRGWINA